jgi:hypothetical protein
MCATLCVKYGEFYLFVSLFTFIMCARCDACMCACASACAFTCMSAHGYACCMYVYLYECMQVFTHAHRQWQLTIHTHALTHTHTHVHKQTVHIGMWESAVLMDAQLSTTIEEALHGVCKGYKLTVTGHSLGAGVATLLALRWKSVSPDLVCVLYFELLVSVCVPVLCCAYACLCTWYVVHVYYACMEELSRDLLLKRWFFE